MTRIATMSDLSDQCCQHGGVLVHESDERFRNVIAGFLEDEGFEACLASADDLIAALRANPERYDVLLTIATSDEADGKNLAQACQQLKPELKVLFASRYSRLELLSQFNLLVPSDALIRKPFGRRALIRKLKEVLGS